MKRKILVVGDEIFILKSLHADLVQAGYEVTVAEKGEEALVELTHDNYNLIITDLR